MGRETGGTGVLEDGVEAEVGLLPWDCTLGSVDRGLGGGPGAGAEEREL